MCISVVIELFDLGYRYLHINIIMFKVEFSFMWQEIKKKNIEARNCKDYIGFLALQIYLCNETG